MARTPLKGCRGEEGIAALQIEVCGLPVRATNRSNVSAGRSARLGPSGGRAEDSQRKDQVRPVRKDEPTAAPATANRNRGRRADLGEHKKL